MSGPSKVICPSTPWPSSGSAPGPRGVGSSAVGGGRRGIGRRGRRRGQGGRGRGCGVGVVAAAAGQDRRQQQGTHQDHDRADHAGGAGHRRPALHGGRRPGDGPRRGPRSGPRAVRRPGRVGGRRRGVLRVVLDLEAEGVQVAEQRGLVDVEVQLVQDVGQGVDVHVGPAVEDQLDGAPTVSGVRRLHSRAPSRWPAPLKVAPVPRPGRVDRVGQGNQTRRSSKAGTSSVPRATRPTPTRSSGPGSVVVATTSPSTRRSRSAPVARTPRTTPGRHGHVELGAEHDGLDGVLHPDQLHPGPVGGEGPGQVVRVVAQPEGEAGTGAGLGQGDLGGQVRARAGEVGDRLVLARRVDPGRAARRGTTRPGPGAHGPSWPGAGRAPSPSKATSTSGASASGAVVGAGSSGSSAPPTEVDGATVVETGAPRATTEPASSSSSTSEITARTAATRASTTAATMRTGTSRARHRPPPSRGVVRGRRRTPRARARRRPWPGRPDRRPRPGSRGRRGRRPPSPRSTRMPRRRSTWWSSPTVMSGRRDMARSITRRRLSSSATAGRVDCRSSGPSRVHPGGVDPERADPTHLLVRVVDRARAPGRGPPRPGGR